VDRARERGGGLCSRRRLERRAVVSITRSRLLHSTRPVLLAWTRLTVGPSPKACDAAHVAVV
jgi:hypothetical protein